MLKDVGLDSALTDSMDMHRDGGIAQLGERLLCKQEVIGSIPFASTIFFFLRGYLQKLSDVYIIHSSCK